jgi:hypothetical protein
MHRVGIIVVHTFFVKLSLELATRAFTSSIEFSCASYDRALAPHALCIESGLLLPALFLRSSHFGPSYIMHRVGTIIAQSRDYRCPESGLSLPTFFLRSSHLSLIQGLSYILQNYADLIRSIRSIASRLASRRPDVC